LLHGAHKYGCISLVKTRLEVPNPLFRKAKAAAAARGQTLKQLVNEALGDKLAKPEAEGGPGWMRFCGTMKSNSGELRRIDAAIEEEFERIDPEMWK
jgi:hypothetical protein